MRIGLIPKLLLSVLLVIVVMTGGLVAAVYWTFEGELSRYLQRIELEQVKPLADLLGEKYHKDGGWHFLSNAPDSWPVLIAEAFGQPIKPGNLPPSEVLVMIPRLMVFDSNDRLIVRPPFGGPPVLRTPRNTMPGGPDQVHPQHQRNIPELQAMPIVAGGKTVGWLKMIPTPIPAQGLDQQFRQDRLRTFYLAAIPALLIAMIIAIPLGLHFLKPLRRLTRHLHLLANGDYKVRLTTTRNDEIGALERDFNHLAQALERADNLRRESMANVSHELRTPISTMMAEIEAMIDGIRPLNSDQLQQLAGSMEHLNGLVDDLYQLALADVGKLVYERVRVEWDEEVIEVVESMRARLAARGLDLNVEVQEHVPILGDSLRLHQLMTNLLENCWRYTDVPGEVSVSLKKHGQSACLQVSDSGPGVSRASLQGLFDRFSREESSRSRHHGGAGLGLSLVKAIVEAHDGSVSAQPSTAGGLAIVVDIPLIND